jgi:adenine-specific DNA-methyltransferase
LTHKPRFIATVKELPKRLNSLVHADCRDALARLPEGCAALTHSSPPYNIGRKYAGFRDKQDVTEYEDLIRTVARELFRVTREGGSVFWQVGYTGYGKDANGGEGTGIKVLDALSLPIFEEAGFRLWDRIIWNYYGSMAFKSKFTNRHETILWLTKPGAAPLFQLDEIRERSKSYDGRNHLFGRNPGNVWYSERVAFGATGQTSHIAVFPEEVSEKIVRACSEVGDLVLDPFSGSGTLAKVAYSLGRTFAGAEITEQYINEADNRLRLWGASEVENLAIGLLVKYAFHGQTETKPLRYLVDALSIHVLDKGKQTDLRVLRSLVEEILGASRVTAAIKRRKAETWERYDDVIRSRDESDEIITADRSLAFCYAHRKHWNGVRRYLTAGTLLEKLRSAITRAGGPEDYIQQLCQTADRRFRIERRNVECLSVDPGLGCGEVVKNVATRAEPQAELFAQ